jgi:subtilisin-like proprotein convertase family protein
MACLLIFRNDGYKKHGLKVCCFVIQTYLKNKIGGKPMSYTVTNSKFITLFFLVVFAVSANSQTLTGIDPGPADEEVSQNNYQSESEVIQQSDRPVCGEPFAQTDEYGLFHFNAYLTNLGASGGYVAIPNPSNESYDGSIEAWIYPTATTSSSPCIVGKGDATNVSFLFGWQASTGLLYMRFGNTAKINTGGTAVSMNKWTHVAVTWTGGAGNYTVTFYVDGVQSGSPVVNTGTWNVNSDSMTIGSIRANFSGKNFYGNIDEVKYWSDVRNWVEIRYNRFVGLGDGTAANSGNAITSSAYYAGLIASYNFNTGGSTVPDYIGGYDSYIRNGARVVYADYAPQPVPYNYVLFRPIGGSTNYVTVPHNTAFNQTDGGTIEMWYFSTNSGTTQWCINKGSSSNVSFGFGVSSANKLVIRFGNTAVSNTTGVSVPAYKWTHIAASWTGSSGNYTVKFYVNGKQSGSNSSVAGTWNLTSDPLTIGISLPFSLYGLLGYIDEVRYWSDVRTEEEILRSMFASGRALLPDASLIGLWNFDGNLKNFSATSGINGSFNVGGTNYCKFSAYLGDAVSFSPAYATVLCRGGSPDPFPDEFIIKAPDKQINDFQTTRDTIYISGSADLYSINVFLAVRHTCCMDLDVTLRAPNGETRDLTSDNGSSGYDILTFFVDGATPVTTAEFKPPWTNLAGPEEEMGTFGGTNIHGNWILEIYDDQSSDEGMLIGWGLRINNGNTDTQTEPVNTPGVFRLYQNYPNPFNPVTSIKFNLPKPSIVKLIVYDVLGREVRTLMNEFKEADNYELQFDGSSLASGVYYCRIEAGDFVDVKKMVLVK